MVLKCGKLSVYSNEDNFSLPELAILKQVMADNGKLSDWARQYFYSLGYQMFFVDLDSQSYNGKEYYRMLPQSKCLPYLTSDYDKINLAWLVLFRTCNVFKKYAFLNDYRESIPKYVSGAVLDQKKSSLKLIANVSEALLNIQSFKDSIRFICYPLTVKQEQVMREIEDIEEYLKNFHDNDAVIVDYETIIELFNKEDLDNYDEVEKVKDMFFSLDESDYEDNYDEDGEYAIIL